MELLKTMLHTYFEQMTDAQMWTHAVIVIIKIAVIIIGAKIIVKIAYRAIEEVFKKREHSLLTVNERRVNTINKLLTNVVGYVVYFVMVLMILTQFFEVTPILASVGVVGLAVGFGAQSLVKDVITGFFILFEDQFAVGDTVKIKDYQGVVIDFGLRVTKLKSWTGEIYMIPNGMIAEVTNLSKADSIAIIDVRVASERGIGEIKQVLGAILQKAAEEIDDIVGKTEVLGVQEVLGTELVIRVIAACNPATNREVERILRERIHEELGRYGFGSPHLK